MEKDEIILPDFMLQTLQAGQTIHAIPTNKFKGFNTYQTYLKHLEDKQQPNI